MKPRSGRHPDLPDRESVLPAVAEKAAVVQSMFDAIAPRYDALNHVLSFNRDRTWRRRAVDRLLAGRAAEGTFLDACAGTLDLARELAGRSGFRGRVLAGDFALAMLERGAAKVERLPVSRMCADTMRLPLADHSLDGATVGFGVRNLASLETGLRELARVLRPGARLVILEFTTPRRQPLRALYLFYFRRVLPVVGALVSRHGTAYRYLPESVLAFPEPGELATLLERCGFEHVRWETWTGGIVGAHVAERSRTQLQETATES